MQVVTAELFSRWASKHKEDLLEEINQLLTRSDSDWRLEYKEGGASSALLMMFETLRKQAT